MKKIRRGLTVVIGGFLVGVPIACQPPAQEGGMQETAAMDTAAVMASLDSLRSAFEEAFDAGDVATMAGYYAQDAVYAAAGGPPVTGRSAIRSGMEQNLPPEGATISIEPTRTVVVSADWAWELGVSTVSFTPEGADAPQEMSDSYLVVLRRTADGWRLAGEALTPHQMPTSSGM